MTLPAPDYQLLPYITPYLKELEHLLFEHRGHEINLIIDQTSLHVGCLTCNEHLLLKPILVYRVPILNSADPRELPPTPDTPD